MNTKSLRFPLAVLPVALVLALFGCSASPMKPLDASAVPSAGDKSPGFVSSSSVIDGSEGGVVKLGNWMVSVPPGAYSGTATVSIVTDSLSSSTCELAISPGSLGDFKAAVGLEYMVTSGNEALSKEMYEWDPAVNGWRSILTTPDCANVSIQSSVHHFGRFGCWAKGDW